MYDYGARFYDPALGRFIQPDSLVPQPSNPLAWDRYSYVYNNPVNRIDPSGHDPWYCNGNKECMKNDFTQRGYTLGYSNAGGPPLRSQNNPPQLPKMPSFLDMTIPGTTLQNVPKEPTILTNGTSKKWMRVEVDWNELIQEEKIDAIDFWIDIGGIVGTFAPLGHLEIGGVVWGVSEVAEGAGFIKDFYDFSTGDPKGALQTQIEIAVADFLRLGQGQVGLIGNVASLGLNIYPVINKDAIKISN